jgi:hypothetical protein
MKDSDAGAYARGFVDGANTRSDPVDPALIRFLRDHAGHEFEVRLAGCGMFTVFCCTVCDHELALEARGEELSVIMGYESGHAIRYPEDKKR